MAEVEDHSTVELDKQTTGHISRKELQEIDDPTSSKTRSSFGWFLPRILAVIFFIVLFLWIFRAEGGLGFEDSNLFGWHALLMGLFIVVFTQEAVLSFSSPLISSPFGKKRTSHGWQRNFHVIFHALGIICAMLGIVAIVYYKKLSPQPPAFPFYSVYSPHSWLGITILILWGLQMAAAIFIHAIDKLSPHNKARLTKVHRYLGKVIYVAGLATCALGLQDMQSSDLAGSTAPIPGFYDTMDMGGGQWAVIVGNETIFLSGYYPTSPEAQYSSACTILLLFLGMATFGTLTF